MLGLHVRFLAKVSPQAARKTQAALMRAMRSLASMPGRYPFFNEDFIPPNKYRRMFVEKWYLVLYQVKDNTVLVEYIVDCREEYGWLMR